MGALEIRNKQLRCINCLDIRRLLIIPGYPDPKIEIMCHCNKSEESLLDYCSELKKVNDFQLICQKCGKEEIKHPRFCYECLSVYCSKCCFNHLPRKTGEEDNSKRASLSGHKTIHVEKLDFFCVKHQNENFIGFCQQCLMNICPLCFKEETHQYHQVELFSVIKVDKKAKDDIKKSLKKAEKKIEKNNKEIKSFIKKYKKNLDLKEMEEEFKICSEENVDILELMKNCYKLYDDTKIKNYSIIYNLIKNSGFNLKRLKLEKSTTTEEKADAIMKYLKKDFFILYKRSKANIEEFDINNDEAQDEEEEEKDDDKEEIPVRPQSNTQKISIKKPELQQQNLNEINPIKENENENEIDNTVPYSAPQNFLQQEEQVDYEKDVIDNNNNASQQPKNEIKRIKMPAIFENHPKNNPSPSFHQPTPKKLKMPLMFEKKEEEKKPEKPLPAMAKIKMPSMFDKKEEDNKPKERAAIISTGAKANMGDRKDFLAQMMEKKGGMVGKPKNAVNTGDSSQPPEEKIEIIHESNEGKTEDVLNKVTVTNKKKKKPRKAKFALEGEENQEKTNPAPAPEENKENNSTQENNQESQQVQQQEKQEQQEQQEQNKENNLPTIQEEPPKSNENEGNE